jgi:beta-galactosidase
MKKIIYLIVAITMFYGCTSPFNKPQTDQRDQIFNSGWKFTKDNLSANGASLAEVEKNDYDDSAWQNIDLPHDWSIEKLPGADTEDKIGPFSKNNIGGGRVNAWVEGGTGFYRKSFIIDKNDTGKSVVIKFDGVYNESEIWINGKYVGANKNGYAPFWFDITQYLKPAGESNQIAVKVENTGKSARWYSGSGIYRNVHLIVTDPLHISVWGTYITTPEITNNKALVNVNVTIQNDGDISKDSKIKINILDPDGKIVAQTVTEQSVETGKDCIINEQLPVHNPELWSLESPRLYTANIQVLTNNIVVDKYQQTFGIRSIEYSATKGFLVNGEPILLKGGSVHHDNGLLGSKAINRAEERRVEILKANGFNAIRCSHNPPSEAFLDACDRLGMLVINEFFDIWTISKTEDDYSKFFNDWWKLNLRNTMLRDRNHPSIIMWSIGNEIPEAVDESGVEIGKELISEVKKLDTTRGITEAQVDIEMMMGLKSNWDKRAPYVALLDVVGYNYDYRKYENDHEKYPERVMYGSESYPRDVYEFWKAVEIYPWVIGDFVWTAMDYFGESGIGKTMYIPIGESVTPTEEPHLPANLLPFLMNNIKKLEQQNTQQQQSDYGAAATASIASPWPWFNAWCGDIDVTGEKKPQMAYKNVIWDNSIIEMLVHAPVPEGMKEVVSLWGWPDEWPSWNWNGNEGNPTQIRIFTKAPQVRLELNGNKIAEKALTETDKYIAVFEVPYQSGVLKAIALKDGKEIGSKILETTDAPYAIRLTADRNSISTNSSDLSFIKIEVIDKNGQLIPTDSTKIKLTATGDGELAASGNANPVDMKSINNPEVKTFKGKAQAILRPNGNNGSIVLKAETEGLVASELKIECK